LLSKGQICKKGLEASSWRKGWPPKIVAVDLGARTQRDFAEVAAERKTMDLLGTVDPTVAPAAGALGEPTWMMTLFPA
jgi:hypothetical protein